jgi:predicted nucleic acid-binding protein
MSGNILIDTNIWVYLYAKSPQEKYLKVQEIIENNFDSLIISTQVVGELFNVLIKKKLVEPDSARDIIRNMVDDFFVHEIDTDKVLQALEINSQYRYSYWDSLIIATGLLTECEIIYSEDMQHNQVIQNQIRIINPFLAS